MSEPMSDVIVEYQKWKQQGDDLRLKAKQAMESRFRELLAEAARIAGEYRTDFGSVLKPPLQVTAFRYKAPAKSKTKKATKPNLAGRPKASEARAEQAAQKQLQSRTPEVKSSQKVVALQRRLATAKTKLEAAKAAGAPTRALDDRIYEIEDELRLIVTARA
jgi:hypothetical protein